jgi:hypothetical protein
MNAFARKLLLASVLSCAAPVAASAHTWYLLNFAKATCNNLEDMGSSPSDLVGEIRADGAVPKIKIGKDDAGNPAFIFISFVSNNGQDVSLYMFADPSNCQDMLNAEIKVGAITPPSDLN